MEPNRAWFAGGEGPSASVQNVRLQLNPGCSDEPKDQDLSAIVSLSEGQGGDLSALISARDGCFARAALTTKSQGGSLVLGESKYTGGHSAVGFCSFESISAAAGLCISFCEDCFCPGFILLCLQPMFRLYSLICQDVPGHLSKIVFRILKIVCFA